MDSVVAKLREIHEYRDSQQASLLIQIVTQNVTTQPALRVMSA